MHANFLICKNSESIEVEPKSIIELHVIRRWRLHELSIDKDHIVYNRMLSRPTKAVIINLPNDVLNNYNINIEMVDYNYDKIDILLNEENANNIITYKILPAANNRKRFFIMDKIIIEFKDRGKRYEAL